MPPLRTARLRKAPPDGFSDIENTLLEFGNKMKDAENATHENRKKHEMVWPVFQITHQRMSRSSTTLNVHDHSVISARQSLNITSLTLLYTGSKYIYDLFYEKKAISRQLYEWLLKNGYGDANLIAKWKKQGYEKVRLHSRYTREYTTNRFYSSAACAASKLKRLTSTRPASVAFPRLTSKMSRLSSASPAAAEAAPATTERFTCPSRLRHPYDTPHSKQKINDKLSK